MAQGAAPSCPADRPVDDIITEVHKQQSKMKHRNTNPFPDVGCIWGWCRDKRETPNTFPEPAPGTNAQNREGKQTSSDESSSKGSSTTPVNSCDVATEQALEAAHSVDVGDFNFTQKNYQGALMRYQDAAERKPGDAAIFVRLGRTFEKLDQRPRAIEQYEAALKLAGPEKWTQEAKSALARLQSAPRL